MYGIQDDNGGTETREPDELASRSSVYLRREVRNNTRQDIIMLLVRLISMLSPCHGNVR